LSRGITGMNTKRWDVGVIALAVAVLAVQGCTVGPNYSQPQARSYDEWGELLPSGAATGPATRPSARPPVLQWWRTFGDRELDAFGGVRRSVEAANADIAAAIEDRRDVMVSLLAEVARNYVDLRGFQRQIIIARENLAAQQQTLDLTRNLQRGGRASDLDVA